MTKMNEMNQFKKSASSIKKNNAETYRNLLLYQLITTEKLTIKEILDLKWDQLNFDERNVSIENKTVTLSQLSAKLLYQFYSRFFKNEDLKGKYIFVNRFGKKLTYRTLNNHFKSNLTDLFLPESYTLKGLKKPFDFKEMDHLIKHKSMCSTKFFPTSKDLQLLESNQKKLPPF